MLILVCRHVATILPIAASLGHQRIFLWLLPGWLRLHTCSDVVSPSFDRMSSKHHVCPTLGWHRRINFPTRCTHGFATYEYTMYIYICIFTPGEITKHPPEIWSQNHNALVSCLSSTNHTCRYHVYICKYIHHVYIYSHPYIHAFIDRYMNIYIYGCIVYRDHINYRMYIILFQHAHPFFSDRNGCQEFRAKSTKPIWRARAWSRWRSAGATMTMPRAAWRSRGRGSWEQCTVQPIA